MRREFSAGVVTYSIDIRNGAPIRMYLLLAYPRGYWDFAKGKLEAGEDSKDAAIRELQEETGLSVRFDEGFMEELYYKFTDPQRTLVDKKVTFFLGEASSQEVTLSHEHKGYCWLPYEEACKKLTFLNARTLLTHAEEFLKNK